MSIRLRSSDNQIFQVHPKVARMSTYIRDIMHELGIENGNSDYIIPIKQVTGNILELVLEWADYHKDDRDEVRSLCVNLNGGRGNRNTDKSACPWDVEFLKKDQKVLFQILMAASYLDIVRLLEMVCQTVGDMMKAKNAQDIQTQFIISNFQPKNGDRKE